VRVGEAGGSEGGGLQRGARAGGASGRGGGSVTSLGIPKDR